MPDHEDSRTEPRTSDNMEWRAWHRILLAFDKLNINMNDPQYDEIVEAIKVWGEWRAQQHRDQHFRYHEVIFFDPDVVAHLMTVNHRKEPHIDTTITAH